jgi:hypothetical protein
MTTVIYERRSISEALSGQPFKRSEKQFRSGFAAMLFVMYVELLGPGRDYERATFA